jgi:arylsulfatase A-like enzyme
MNRFTKMLPPEYALNLSSSAVTIAEVLRQQGYKTFFAGKWHLGSEGSYPEDHGFDINKGGSQAGAPSGGYFSPYNNPTLSDGPNGEDLSRRLAEETAAFIKNQVSKNAHQPFFAYLSFYAVHSPIQTTQARWKYFRDKAEKQGIAQTGFIIDRTLPVHQTQDNPIYAGLVQQMDDAIGLVLQQLKDLGIDKNTMVVFTSDNGGVSSGDDFSTSNLPLRGGKGRQWEAGTRVPLIIKTGQEVKNKIESSGCTGVEPEVWRHRRGVFRV